MNEKLQAAIDDFITQRTNDHGADAPDAVGEAITDVSLIEKKLIATLSPEQEKLWNELEDALSLQTGEENNYYYRAGFSDAIQFIINQQNFH